MFSLPIDLFMPTGYREIDTMFLHVCHCQEALSGIFCKLKKKICASMGVLSASMSVHHLCLWRPVCHLELELHMVVSLCVSVGIELRSSGRAYALSSNTP